MLRKKTRFIGKGVNSAILDDIASDKSSDEEAH